MAEEGGEVREGRLERQRTSFLQRSKSGETRVETASARGLTRAFVRGTAQMVDTSAVLMVVPSKAKRKAGLFKWAS